MRLERVRGLLLAIDLQENLVPALCEGRHAADNAVRLMTAAGRLGVPVVLTEQYPQGLGRTDPAVRAAAPEAIAVEKTSFDASSEPAFAETLTAARRRQAVLCGAEAHVCVLQTALGLLARGYEVAVCADAVASRAPSDRDAALARLAANGVEIVTTEMVLFEWIGRAATPEFRELLGLIK